MEKSPFKFIPHPSTTFYPPHTNKVKSSSALNKALKEHLSSLNLIKKLNDLTNMKTAKKNFTPSYAGEGRAEMEETAQKAKSTIDEKKRFFGGGQESKKKRQLMEILSGASFQPKNQEKSNSPIKNQISRNSSQPKSNSNSKSKSKSHEKKVIPDSKLRSVFQFGPKSQIHAGIGVKSVPLGSKKQSLNQIFSNMRSILNDIPRKSAQILPTKPHNLDLDKKHRSVEPSKHELIQIKDSLENLDSWNYDEIIKAIVKIKECGQGSHVIEQLTAFMLKVVEEIQGRKNEFYRLEKEKHEFVKEKESFDQELGRLREETLKFEKVLESSFKFMKETRQSNENKDLKREVKKQKLLITFLTKEIENIKVKQNRKDEGFADHSS